MPELVGNVRQLKLDTKQPRETKTSVTHDKHTDRHPPSREVGGGAQFIHEGLTFRDLLRVFPSMPRPP